MLHYRLDDACMFFSGLSRVSCVHVLVRRGLLFAYMEGSGECRILSCAHGESMTNGTLDRVIITHMNDCRKRSCLVTHNKSEERVVINRAY